jgi:dephospho-CoA kinase
MRNPKTRIPELKSCWVKLTTETRLHQCPIPIVAITGGIASGKSTLVKFFRDQGVPCLSADELVKKIYRTPELLNFLKNKIPSVLTHENNIDFGELRKIFFSEKSLQKELESLIYQRLPSYFVKENQNYKNFSWIVYEVPLLFEKQLEKLVDVVIVSWISPEEQLKRLLKRDPQMNTETAHQILANQLPPDIKKKKADLIFVNQDGREDEKKQLLLQELVGP